MGATAGIVAAGASVAGGISEAQAAEAQGDFARAQAEENARLAEAQAADIETRGQKEAGQFRRKVRGVVGSQRAALAAQGIDIGSGTAKDIAEETAAIGEQEASQIRINAIRQAFGVRTQAINTRAQGEFDQIAGKSAASSALLTGGLGAISSGLGGLNFDAKPSTKTTKKSSGPSAQGGPAVKDFSSFA